MLKLVTAKRLKTGTKVLEEEVKLLRPQQLNDLVNQLEMGAETYANYVNACREENDVDNGIK